MDENKNFEEKVEETVEEIKEKAEDAAEEIVEEVKEVAEDAVEDAKEFVQEVFEAPKKKNIAPIIAIIVAAVLVVALCVLTAMGKFPQIYNKYNHMGYVNITDRTIADIAEENGIELSELLKQYNLPEDMPGNTKESAAYYMMPVKSIAQMYGMGLEDIKELLGLSDDVTEDTPWGIAEGEVTIEKYIGADNFDSFKEEYGFGDEITLETKWKEVRNTVDKEARRKYEEQKAEQEAETDETAAETEEETEEAEETEDAE